MTTIQVKVIPGASFNKIEGWQEGVLKIRIAAPPDKGKANAELVRMLAKTLKIAKSKIRIVSGESSRKKSIEIEDLSREEIERLLQKGK